MKTIYDVEQRFFIDGMKDFQPTSIRYHLRALDEDEVMELENRYTFQTFDELYKWVEAGHVLNATANPGFFGRSVVFASGMDKYRVSEKRYKPVTLWMHCQKVEMTLDQLSKLLSVDDFFDYLLERGMKIKPRYEN